MPPRSEQQTTPGSESGDGREKNASSVTKNRSMLPVKRQKSCQKRNNASTMPTPYTKTARSVIKKLTRKPGRKPRPQPVKSVIARKDKEAGRRGSWEGEKVRRWEAGKLGSWEAWRLGGLEAGRRES